MILLPLFVSYVPFKPTAKYINLIRIKAQLSSQLTSTIHIFASLRQFRLLSIGSFWIASIIIASIFLET